MTLETTGDLVQTLTSSRQGLTIAWRSANAYSVDGTRSWPLRVYRWPGFFFVLSLGSAVAAGDTVWLGNASICVPCRARRPFRVLPGLVVFVFVLAMVVVLVCLAVATPVVHLVAPDAAPAATNGVTFALVGMVLLGPLVGPLLRPTRMREAAALRRWRRDLERDGRTVAVARTAAAWPMRRGAFSALVLEVRDEAREAGQTILLHARNPVIADIYLRKGCQPHPDFPSVLAFI